MKKWIVLVSVVLVLSACANNEKEPNTSTEEKTVAEENWSVEKDSKKHDDIDKDVNTVKKYGEKNGIAEGVKGAEYVYDHTEGDYRIVMVQVDMGDRTSTVATLAINTKTNDVLDVTVTPLSEQVNIN